MLKILKYVKQYKIPTILSSVTVGIEVFVEILVPLAIARLLDLGIEDGNMHFVYVYGGYLLILAVLQICFGVLSGRFAAIAGVGFASNLRKVLFDKVQTYSFYNIDKFSTGSIVSRLTTDITNIQQAYQMTIRMAVRGVLMTTFSIIAAFSINAQIASVFLLVLPFMIISFLILVKIAFPLFTKMFKGYDELNNILSENLRGIRVVKTFCMEDYEIKKFKSMSSYIYSIGLKASQLMAVWFPIMNIAIYTTSILILWLGAKAIIASGNNIIKGMTTGTLTSLITYSVQMLISLMMMSFVSVMIVIASSSTKRVNELLDEESDIVNKENPIKVINDGSIEFSNVYFTYDKNSTNYVLKNINVKIKSGERIGIMGMTGSGKSTLVNLIPRFYDVNKGSIKVSGVDVRDLDLETLRRTIGMVLQKNVLFKGTIRSNMEFGKLDATDEEINKSLDIACAKDFVYEKENGLNSEVEQGGSNFSGGQKQRLCIARAVVKEPKILILDDSTSAVDTATDAKIRKGFNDYHKDATLIIIAQRITSIMNLDRIIVLDNGKIQAIGTHEELLKTSTIYKETYELQMQGGLE